MRFFTVCCFCLTLLCGAAPRAHAFSRSYRPIGDYVRESPLVIIADISTSDAPPFDTTLEVRETLKGDAKPGERLAIPLGITRWVVPAQAQNVAVVMAPDWRCGARGNGLLVSEVYQTPDQIAAVRALVEVYRAPGERARLRALRALAGQGNAFLDEQLVADLSRMRERANFEIALAGYARLQTSDQVKLIQLFGTIGDARALPLLLGALDAPEPQIWRAAAAVLTRRFPDAPGVSESLRKWLPDSARRPLVLGYLARRDPTLKLPAVTPTNWMRAEKSLQDGDLAAARAAFFAVVDADAESKYGFSTIWAAQKLVPLVQTETDKTRLRRALWARLQTNSDYSSVTQIIELLRALPAPENVAALLPKLSPPTDELSVFLWHQPARAATFALLELGAGARQRGAASVGETLRTRGKISDEQAAIAVCELAWLADDATWKNAAQIAPKIASRIATLQPLRDAAQSKDPARALAALLPDTQNRWQNHADLWIIARLGELGDPIAVEPLLAELKRAPYAGRDQEFKRALLQIGGDKARDGALELLGFPEPSQRALGLDVLSQLPGYDARPLLLKTLAGDDQDDKIQGIFLLGYVGTPEDLPVLEKLADFWTTDLAYQRSATDAIAGIRLRYELE